MKPIYSVIILSFSVVFLAFCISCFYSYFYPMQYVDIITSEAENSGVEAGLIASVINVESSYKSDTVSSKGAVGLMQLMPDTARWVCERNAIDYREDDLIVPKYNIKIGALYLKYLLSYFGDLDNALCAYNAGLGNVRSWLSNKQYCPDGKKLALIPFPETKNYLQKIHKNYRYYSEKY